MVGHVADGASWNRSNWCATEFNLLYRWHSLVPDTVRVGGQELDAGDIRNNDPLVLREGVEALLTGASTSRAGRIGLGNTPAFLVDSPGAALPSLEQRTVALMRKARLRSYNDYRERFGLRRLRDFDDLTADGALLARLRDLYGSIDRLEWSVGIFAEDYPDQALVGDLLTAMVGYDAVTQALTNPLLARQVYDASTFSALGLGIIETTPSLQQVVDRNVADPDRARASFRWTPAASDDSPTAASPGPEVPGQRRRAAVVPQHRSDRER